MMCFNGRMEEKNVLDRRRNVCTSLEQSRKNNGIYVTSVPQPPPQATRSQGRRRGHAESTIDCTLEQTFRVITVEWLPDRHARDRCNAGENAALRQPRNAWDSGDCGG